MIIPTFDQNTSDIRSGDSQTCAKRISVSAKRRTANAGTAPKKRTGRTIPEPRKRPKGGTIQTRSWALPVPEGAYSKVTAWASRNAWYEQLETHLCSAEGETLLKTISISREKVLMVARADAECAEGRTGRDVTTSHDTVANTLEVSKSTVRRSRDLILKLGYAAVVVGGRYLTVEERQEAQSVHGSVQLRAASVRALTVPKNAPRARNEHLPRKGLRSTLTNSSNNSPTRAQARKAASRPETFTKKVRVCKKPRRRFSPAVFSMANELAQRLPFLLKWRTLVTETPGQKPRIRHQGAHLGSICRVIESAGIDVSRLSAHDVIEVIDRITADTGLQVLSTQTVQNPLGYLTVLLRRVAAYVEHPNYYTAAEGNAARSERRAQITAEQAERAAERRAEQAIKNDPVNQAAAAEFFAAVTARRNAQ